MFSHDFACSPNIVYSFMGNTVLAGICKQAQKKCETEELSWPKMLNKSRKGIYTKKKKNAGIIDIIHPNPFLTQMWLAIKRSLMRTKFLLSGIHIIEL